MGLLEQLALRCGCLFVTQLRSVSPYRLRCALDSIDPDRYSLWEWNEAMRLLSLPELLGSTRSLSFFLDGFYSTQFPY